MRKSHTQLTKWYLLKAMKMDNKGFIIAGVEKGKHNYILKVAPDKIGEIPNLIAIWIDDPELDFNIIDATSFYLSIEQLIQEIFASWDKEEDDEIDATSFYLSIEQLIQEIFASWDKEEDDEDEEEKDNPFHIHFDWKPDDDDDDIF